MLGQAAIPIIVHLSEGRHRKGHHGEHRGSFHMQRALLCRHQMRTSMRGPQQQAKHQHSALQGLTNPPLP